MSSKKKAPATASDGDVATRSIPLESIVESPTNQRRTFRDLDELADTIRAHGVLQAVLVRPIEGTEQFELVFGARRFRAAKLGGLSHIPATVRELSDSHALELQIIENSKRDDVHPLEEADGYRELHERHHVPIEEIAAKCAKSETFVQQRLKLCALSREARKAFMAGSLTTATALLVARLASTAYQDQAIKRMGERRYGHNDGPLSVREVGEILQREFLLKLATAPFDAADAALVPNAPACSSCAKNSANQRSLFGELEIEEKGDICTDRPCFDLKKEAGWAKRTAAAKEAGQKVLTAKEAKATFAYGGQLAYGAGYVDLAEKGYDASGKLRTNKAKLGKNDLPIVLARDDNGMVHELVAKADFAKATKAPKAKPTERDTRDKEDRKAAREKEAKVREKEAADLLELVTAAESAEDSEALWRVIARSVARGMWSETQKLACQRRGFEVSKTWKGTGMNTEAVLVDHAATLTAGGARALVVELLVLRSKFDGDFNEEEFREVLLGPKKPAKSKVNPKKSFAKVAKTPAPKKGAKR